MDIQRLFLFQSSPFYSLLRVISSFCISSFELLGFFIQKRAMFGFQFRTAYLSVDFLDRFLSKRSIDVSTSVFCT